MARYQGKVGVFRVSVPLGAEVPLATDSQSCGRTCFCKAEGARYSCISTVRRFNLHSPRYARHRGRLPTIEEAQQFLSDSSATKYEATVDRLLDSPEYADYFAKKWSAILRNKRDGQGELFNSIAFHDWLRTSFYENKSYDSLVRELLTASGSVETNRRLPGTAKSRIRNRALRMQHSCSSVNVFSALVAIIIPLKSGAKRITSTCRLSSPKSLPRKARLRINPSSFHDLAMPRRSIQSPGQSLQPAGLDGEKLDVGVIDDPRRRLADWMVAPDNPFFARSLANRYWKHFFERAWWNQKMTCVLPIRLRTPHYSIVWPSISSIRSTISKP